MFFVASAGVLGFVVGLRHALDVDHVAAVGAIVARERGVGGAALIGAAWGVGHAASLLLVGGAIVACGLVVPQRVGLLLELGVGVMLIGLGAWNAAPRPRRSDERPEPPPGPSSPLRRVLCPLLVGGVHGLAGSAAATLLVVAAGGGVPLSLAYLLVFGLGTTLGMVGLTAALALPFGRALHRSRRAEPWIRLASGALSLVVGGLIVYQIAVGDSALLE